MSSPLSQDKEKEKTQSPTPKRVSLRVSRCISPSKGAPTYSDKVSYLKKIENLCEWNGLWLWKSKWKFKQSCSIIAGKAHSFHICPLYYHNNTEGGWAAGLIVMLHVTKRSPYKYTGILVLRLYQERHDLMSISNVYLHGLFIWQTVMLKLEFGRNQSKINA